MTSVEIHRRLRAIPQGFTLKQHCSQIDIQVFGFSESALPIGQIDVTTLDSLVSLTFSTYIL